MTSSDFNDGLYFCFNEILLYIHVNAVKLCTSYYFFFYPIVVQVIHRRKMAAPVTDSVREKALADYRKKLLEHKELEARLKESMFQYLNRLVNKNQFKLR